MSGLEIGGASKGFGKSFVFRANDPKEYGFICPACSERYGPKQMRGYIDVKRHEGCPVFKDHETSGQYKASPTKRREMARML